MKTKMSDIVGVQDTTTRNERYNQYVKEKTPKKSWMVNLLKAYLVGGIICMIGQAFMQWYMSMGLDKQTASMYNTLSLITLSVLLTGLNVYPKLANYAGAGTVVPITGFANSVAAPAIEFQKEGQVFGIGCKIFTIAGPVILYGIFSSWVLGIIYWVGKLWSWW